MVLRIGCPIPNNSKISPLTEESVNKIKLSNEFERVEVAIVQGCNVGFNRSLAVRGTWDVKTNTMKPNVDNRKYQGSLNYDYFLSIDADMGFEVKDVLSLINHDLPIVGGSYLYRGNQNLLNGGFWAGQTGFTSPEKQLSKDSTGIIKCDWLGTGFLLVKKIVLEAVGYPQFYSTLLRYQEKGVQRVNFIPNDIAFCISAENIGFDKFIDCDIRVKHYVDNRF